MLLDRVERAVEKLREAELLDVLCPIPTSVHRWQRLHREERSVDVGLEDVSLPSGNPHLP